MALTISGIFLILAVVFFLLGAFGVSARVDWTNLGRASVAAALLFWAGKV
jgi:FtsH-binding integral membrane protein